MLKPADISGVELRKEPRIRSRGSLELWTENQERIPGTVDDISMDGLSVTVPQAIRCGDPVRIEGHGFTGQGIVRYCVASGAGFRIGMALMPPA